MIGWLLCKLGNHSCRTLHTTTGIGGQCQRCGRVFGWMTHEEIRACLEGKRTATGREKSTRVELPPAYVVRGPKGLQ